MFLYMKPVCKCGHIFDRLIIGNLLTDDSALHLPYINVSPSHCPKCGEKIKGIKYQNPVDNIFDYDEKKYFKNV